MPTRILAAPLKVPVCPVFGPAHHLPQFEYGYSLTPQLLSKGDDLASIVATLPDTAVALKHKQHQLLLRPSPVLHLRLLIRVVLQQGGQTPPSAAGPTPRKGAGGAAAAAAGLGTVQTAELAAAVAGCISGSSLAVTTGNGLTAYPVVVVQQAFSRVFGFELPLNFLGVENFKHLVQVRF